MEIEITTLKKAFDAILKNLKKEHGDSIKIDNDYYWDINREEKYNPSETPKNLNMGQISFDIENIESGLEDKFFIKNHVAWFANILLVIEKESHDK